MYECEYTFWCICFVGDWRVEMGWRAELKRVWKLLSSLSGAIDWQINEFLTAVMCSRMWHTGNTLRLSAAHGLLWDSTCQQLSKTVRCMFCCLQSLTVETEEKTIFCHAVDLRWTRAMPLSSLLWSVRKHEELWSVEEGNMWYLYALLSSLCAVHHRGERQSGDETRYEMLQTQTQHCHTWGRKKTQSTLIQYCPSQRVLVLKFEFVTLTLHTASKNSQCLWNIALKIWWC